MVYDHSYDLAAVTIARETMRAVNWLAVLSFPAAQWLPYNFVRRKIFLFPTAGYICVTVHEIQHRAALPIITSIPWRRTPPFWKSVQVQATASFSEHYSFHTPSPSHDKIF